MESQFLFPKNPLALGQKRGHAEGEKQLEEKHPVSQKLAAGRAPGSLSSTPLTMGEASNDLKQDLCIGCEGWPARTALDLGRLTLLGGLDWWLGI